MRITVLNPVGVIGGAERVLLAALASVRDLLPDTSLDVVLLADGPLRLAVEQLGVRITIVALPASLAKLGTGRLGAGVPGQHRLRGLSELTWSALRSSPAAIVFLWRLRSALRQTAPDLVHSHGFKAHVLAALTRPRHVALLWHLHDFPGQKPIMARVLRHLTHRAAGAIAVSDAVRRDAAACLPGLPVALAANPTDTGHFAPLPRDGSGLDRLAGLPPAPPGTVRVGLVATFAYWKGQDIFLDALGRLIAAGVPVRGFLVGGPIYSTAGSQFTEDELRGRADALGLAGRVGFVSFQDDPADAYRMLDVVVHASTRPEPFGLTIAEAMASGRPVVVASSGGAAELFTEGHDGIGHKPGDAGDLARVLKTLITEPETRDRLGAAARQTALARHPPGRYGRELAAIYARSLARDPSL